MKTKNSLLLLCAILLFSVTGNTYSQAKVITITLFVNTASVDSQNTDQTCNFGQAEGISNQNFTVEANIGDTIIWRGESTSSPSDIVNITAINHEGGKNVFDQNRLGGNGQTPELVIGTVVTGAPGDEDKYKVSFKVLNNGSRRNGTFHIDPVIKVGGGN